MQPNLNRIKDKIVPASLIALGSLGTAKMLHSAMVEAEPDQDIHAQLKDLKSRKERMQAVRTAFEDRFKQMDLPIVDDGKTEITVGRSMFPWKDKYDVHINLKDAKGKSISDWNTYDADVYKDKDNDYTGYVNMVFTDKKYQGNGVGRKVENRMVDAFRDVGATKARLMPAFDGPVVWAKKDFNYNLAPDKKHVFLKAYKRYCKAKGLPFQDLGDKPSEYPVEFLKVMKEYEPTFSYTYYEKPIEKTASYGLIALTTL